MFGYQALRHHRPEIQGQVHQQLSPTLFGEKVDDAVKRLIGAVGVQGAQTQVACFGKSDGMFHRFTVTHFTHQNDIGRLPQCVFERCLPAVRVQANLTLGDDTIFVGVYKFHRVFNRDDVAKRLFVTPVHHGGQGGGFTGTCGTHQNRQATFGHHHFLEHLGHTQPVNRRQYSRNHPHHHADLALLNKCIDAKPPHAWRADGKVALFGAFKFCGLLVVHDGTRQGHGVPRIQRLGRHLGDLAIHLDGGREITRDEQVTAVAADHQFEQVVDEFTGLVAFHVRLLSKNLAGEVLGNFGFAACFSGRNHSAQIG